MEKLQLPITPDILKTFKKAKVFSGEKYQRKPISSLDFDDSGDFCVTCSQEEENICLYNCIRGSHEKLLFSKKYGIDLIKFTHSSTNIIHSSTREDDTIRYLSLHDNKYVRYFRGHSGRVVSMDVSPVDDTFISASLDKTVRVWDLRSNNCQGLANVSGPCSVAFDPQGLVFAIASDTIGVRLYDVRNYEEGPFGSIPLSAVNRSRQGFVPGDQWSGVKFSNNTRDMLITTRQGRTYVVDSLEYQMKHVLTGVSNLQQQKIEASFTPDGEHIVSGSDDGSVFVWDIGSGTKIAELSSDSDPVTVAQFNPKRMMMVTGGSTYEDRRTLFHRIENFHARINIRRFQ